MAKKTIRQSKRMMLPMRRKVVVQGVVQVQVSQRRCRKKSFRAFLENNDASQSQWSRVRTRLSGVAQTASTQLRDLSTRAVMKSRRVKTQSMAAAETVHPSPLE